MLKKAWFWALIIGVLIASLLTYGAVRQVQVWLYEPIPISEPTLVTVSPG
ncbi:MAG: hypothetical protein ACI9MN_000436, partial [Saprospiraceae bacterium]